MRAIFRQFCLKNANNTFFVSDGSDLTCLKSGITEKERGLTVTHV